MLKAAAFGLASVFAFLPADAQAQSYAMTYLGALSSSHNSVGLSVNSRGDVAGISSAGEESRAVFFGADGRITDLGALRRFSTSVAVSINDAGQVAGSSSRTLDSQRLSQAFLQKGRKLDALGFLPGADSSSAAAVNNSAVVVGESGGIAFRFSGNQMRSLGALAGQTTSRAGTINNVGVIAGNSGARLFRSTGETLADLGQPSNAVSLAANGINETGDIVGTYRETENGEDQAFLHSASQFTNLGSLGGGAVAHDINNAGQIVGTSANRAFLWKSGGMTDLNSLVTLVTGTSGQGFTELTRALAINDAGQIAGEGRYRDAAGVIRLRAFLLTPIPENSPAAPVISPGTGDYQSTVIVSITATGTTGVVRYTTNGSDPTETSPIYAGPFVVDASRSIKARTFLPDGPPSVVSLARYTIIPALTGAALPVISPVAGTYPPSLTITMSCPTPNALIRYTINGSDPTASSNPYIEPFVLRSSATVKARAFATGIAPSPPVSTPYVVLSGDPNFVATPIIRPPGASFTNSVRVKISCATASAVIFYTVDGTDPTTISPKYTGPFSVTETTTVKARAYNGPHPGKIADATYTKTAP